jgi:hypothetical protein
MLGKTLMMAAAVAGLPQGPVLHYQSLSGGWAHMTAALPDSRDTIIIFWRADCAPCVDEMLHISDYRRAAGATRVMAVALQPQDEALKAARRFGFSPAGLYATDDDPRQTLVAFGGAPARLPLSVHLDGTGRILALRHGLLGTDIIKAWTQ